MSLLFYKENKIHHRDHEDHGEIREASFEVYESE